ncbi:hypothetical protein [Persicitalea sp.]|uniref:Cap15 family cyclic dinucleotide receptor domain-containing protein n=1 Tax=Persicitalea sp. TaxID=3100273 RepID=UPI0035934FDC
MKKEELDSLIKISAYSAILLTLLLLLLNDSIEELSTIFRAVTTSVSIVVLFWGLYFKWLWKYCPFKYLLYRPNISGTWKGILASDWKDKNGLLIQPKIFFIVIRQNFLDTNITTFTDNFIGVSYAENLLLNDARGEKKLTYLYRKDTADVGIQESNEGACELRINERQPMNMEGRYWSNIKTKGIIKVIKLSDDIIISFQEGLTLTEK